MKLSTRCRYGTRLIVDLSMHHEKGPIPMTEIANRQGVSVKYLEQLIIPLKKAKMIKSVRGTKGGHMLARPPEKITVGQVVRVLEGGSDLVPCMADPNGCNLTERCLTRDLWLEAIQAFYTVLDAVTMRQIVDKKRLAGPSPPGDRQD
jgi:Rrf2 family iron-sulfur cluster assembly transcriptional regulator